MGKARRPPAEVLEGQVWADNDPRNAGRTLRVERIYEDGMASCKVLTGPTDPTRYGSSRGGVVRIALRRFRPTRNGYCLISEPPTIGKSAEQRADEIEQAIRAGGYAGRIERIRMIVRHFKEHARDQRHLCAEAVPYGVGKVSLVPTDPVEAHAGALSAAHAAVLNAPEPGKHHV